MIIEQQNPRATSLVPTIPKLRFLAILSDILKKWDKIETYLFGNHLGQQISIIIFEEKFWNLKPLLLIGQNKNTNFLRFWKFSDKNVHCDLLNWDTTIWLQTKKCQDKTLITSEIMWVIWNRRSLFFFGFETLIISCDFHHSFHD